MPPPPSIHWAENLAAPYPIGDSTLSAEAARLIIAPMVGGGGGKPLETATGATPPAAFKANMPGTPPRVPLSPRPIETRAH